MDVEVRRLERWEMPEAARVHRIAFDERLPSLSGLHTPDEDRAYFEGPVFDACDVWGAWEGAALSAFIAFRAGWIDQLYVLPSRQGQGLGGRLLDVAKQGRAELRLWTFQRNLAARAFYGARGFMLVELTDGARNEEKDPDALYRWRR